MKKLFILAVTLVTVFMFSSVSFAAMTCVDDGRSSAGGSDATVRLSVTCTFDTTPGTAVAAIPASVMKYINDARYVYTFKTIPGATGPTDNSDLQILDSDSIVILSASGNGANVIDNTAINSIIYGDGPTAGSTNHYPAGDTMTWTITVTNNAVNNSSFTLIMQAVK